MICVFWDMQIHILTGTLNHYDMKSIAEHLRNLSKAHRDRISKAVKIAENIKKAAEAAQRAAEEGRD